MRVSTLLFAPLAVQAINIIQSNDDGWAEINIRTLYDAITAAGHSSFISAPADNESGTGSSDAPATPRTKPCEFSSCPANSPATGRNASMPRFAYVNSYPVTSIKTGLAHPYAGVSPALALTGPNVGSNLARTTLVSGTVGAATYAASAGVPAVAFSGASGSQTAWSVDPVPQYSTLYAAAATTLTNALVADAGAYLPNGTYLNVNFPEAGPGTDCTHPADFHFVLTRINSAGRTTPADVATCGRTRLPTETSVVDADGCYSSVSVGRADTKGDADAAAQGAVLERLGRLLVCPP